MPSTHTSLHYHLVFSTKDRHPVITATWRERLHSYLGGIVKNIDGIPEAIGGTSDHVNTWNFSGGAGRNSTSDICGEGSAAASGAVA